MRMSHYMFTNCILKASGIDQEKSDTSDCSETMNLKKIVTLQMVIKLKPIGVMWQNCHIRLFEIQYENVTVKIRIYSHMKLDHMNPKYCSYYS